MRHVLMFSIVALAAGCDQQPYPGQRGTIHSPPSKVYDLKRQTQVAAFTDYLDGELVFLPVRMPVRVLAGPDEDPKKVGRIKVEPETGPMAGYEFVISREFFKPKR